MFLSSCSFHFSGFLFVVYLKGFTHAKTISTFLGSSSTVVQYTHCFRYNEKFFVNKNSGMRRGRERRVRENKRNWQPSDTVDLFLFAYIDVSPSRSGSLSLFKNSVSWFGTCSFVAISLFLFSFHFVFVAALSSFVSFWRCMILTKLDIT